MRGEKSNYIVSQVRSISLIPHGNPGVKVQLRVIPPEAGTWAPTFLRLSATVKGRMGQGNQAPNKCSGLYFGGTVAYEAQGQSTWVPAAFAEEQVLSVRSWRGKRACPESTRWYKGNPSRSDRAWTLSATKVVINSCLLTNACAWVSSSQRWKWNRHMHPGQTPGSKSRDCACGCRGWGNAWRMSPCALRTKLTMKSKYAHAWSYTANAIMKWNSCYPHVVYLQEIHSRSLTIQNSRCSSLPSLHNPAPAARSTFIWATLRPCAVSHPQLTCPITAS